jgi:hypothetical protein
MFAHCLEHYAGVSYRPSITLPTGHMSIMEDPSKVAAFINMAALAALPE